MSSFKLTSAIVGVLMAMLSEAAVITNFQSYGLQNSDGLTKNFYIVAPLTTVNFTPQNSNPYKNLQEFPGYYGQDEFFGYGSEPQVLGQGHYTFGQNDIQVTPSSYKMTIQMDPRKKQQRSQLAFSNKLQTTSSDSKLVPKNSNQVETQIPVNTDTSLISSLSDEVTVETSPSTSATNDPQILPQKPARKTPTLEQILYPSAEKLIPVNSVQNSVTSNQEISSSLNPVNKQTSALKTQSAKNEITSSSTNSQIVLTETEIARRKAIQLVADVLRRANTIPTRQQKAQPVFPSITPTDVKTQVQPQPQPQPQTQATNPKTQITSSITPSDTTIPSQPQKSALTTEEYIKQIIALAKLQANPSLKVKTQNNGTN